MISELFGSLPCNGEIRTAERLGNIAAWCILLYRQMRRARACTRAQPVAANAVYIEYITSSRIQQQPKPFILYRFLLLFVLSTQQQQHQIYKKKKKPAAYRYRLYNSRRIYLVYLFIIIQRREILSILSNI